MKRSEMYPILRELLYKYVTIDWNDINDDDQAMESILNGLEKAGMLPPNKEGGIVKFKADSGLSGINAMINSHRWEPEDEM